ncbi:unnamed protein product [Hydatigera taeniaeformis]|uniref:Protein FAF-like, chloroplastic n=1 Tax=Hydatigena taeniaeformis TaxID=6205 RepID=A0A0R3WW38_HYDTA|nr:unnamed protein product [Hydatigera taeniaeformis]
MDSPWDSTDEEEAKESLHPLVPQDGDRNSQNASSQSESSPWDSEVETNEVKELNEVSVSTLTQVSESSDKDISIMEEFSKVPIILNTDNSLAEAANRAAASITRVLLNEENGGRLNPTRDLWPIDEQSDEDFRLAAKKCPHSHQEEEEEEEEELPSANNLHQSVVKSPLSEPLCSSRSQSKKTDQDKSGGTTGESTPESNRTASIPILPSYYPTPSLNQTPSRSESTKHKTPLTSPVRGDFGTISPQPRRSRSQLRKETPLSQHMLSPPAPPAEAIECSVNRGKLILLVSKSTA